jgi:hypothetical protein
MMDGPNLEIPVRQFRAMHGREPRMTGKYDAEQARLMVERGYEMAEFTCVGDDVASFEIMREPVPQWRPAVCCGLMMMDFPCRDCPLRSGR